MPIPFATSPRSTLGIEWELALVDEQSFELVNEAPELLAELQSRWPTKELAPQATSELLENTVELVSAPHQRVGEAIADLRALATAVIELGDRRGLQIIGAGSHPYSRWEDQRVTGGERYDRFIDRTRWWGRNMLIWGLHVHVGVDRPDRVIPLLHALLTTYPHLHALSGSSPFWRGEATGYASNRTLMFQQLSTAGLPPEMDDWSSYERIMNDLTKTGIISERTEARWDIRPAPQWGTIELRVSDGAATLWEAAAIAALSQCLMEFFQRELDSGRALPRMQPWFVRENKWRAARYGLEAVVITDTAGSQAPLRDELSRLVDRLAPIAAELDCRAEFDGVSRILSEGTSADRQLAAVDGPDLAPVAALLAREFRESVLGLDTGTSNARQHPAPQPL